MKNKKIFEYSIETVYQVLVDLVIDNANACTGEKKSYTVADLETLKYSYESQMRKGTKKNKVKVTKIKENQLIQYTIAREGMEKYMVSFELISLGKFETQLNYNYDLQTDSKRIQTNHKIMSFFYKRKQKKRFNSMCKYITMKCEEKEKCEDGEC